MIRAAGPSLAARFASGALAPSATLSALALLGALSLALTGCDDDPEVAADAGVPVFPADYLSSFTEVRDCRQSIEHELEYVRLLVPADQAAEISRCMTPGTTCDAALPVGTLLVKPQYLDPGCTDLLRVTAARRETAAAAGDRAAWRWQEVTAAGAVTVDGDGSEGAAARCVGCHAACDPGWDLRCVMDP